MGVLSIVGLGIVGIAAAAVAHEATHASVALAIPGVSVADVEMWPGVHVDIAVPEDYPHVVDLVVGLAPAAVGVVAGAAYVQTAGWPVATPQGLIGVGCWALYSVPSGGDLQAAVGTADASGAFSDILQSYYVLLVGWVVWMVGYGQVLQFVGSGVMLAGAVMLAHALIGGEEHVTRAGA